MPKIKTRRSMKKRFKITASGRIMRMHGGKSHILTKKTRKRKKRLSRSTEISQSWVKKVRPALPYDA